MPLTVTQVERFKEIYRKEYGVELPEAEARAKAERLIRLFRAICVVETERSPATVPPGNLKNQSGTGSV